MFSRPLPRLTLRNLMLAMAVFSVIITLCNSFYATYEVQRTLLINNTLEANRVYAAKLAELTESFIQSTRRQLAYSAGLLNNNMNNEQMLMAEARRLHEQSNAFNSVVIVNAKGIIIAASPDTLQVKGVQLSSANARQSLQAQAPLITDPFVSPSGNYIISLSHPMFSDNGDYLGYVAGTIYLQRSNILGEILGKHYYQDGSYLYVVDKHKTLIYHPEEQYIGERVSNNAAIDTVLAGKEGVLNVVNSHDVDMLTGFAPVASTHWGIVAQRPKEATLASINNHLFNVFVKSIPIALLTLAGIWLSAIFISRPLWQLAKSAEKMNKQDVQQDISGVRSWYFEAAQLKSAILRGIALFHDHINKLHTDSHTDAMTGLLNRRGMQHMLDSYEQRQTPFALIALDIDHFKNVNDTFGHDIGDNVIKQLALIMQEQARRNDILCRSGGEEFMIFLPATDATNALEVAERLRRKVENTIMDDVGSIRISLGVSHWPGRAMTIRRALKQADIALYQAKHQGRNQSVLN
ncbi:sensor domain-containing diguanylate cyclase [Oceanimonas baumannii]|uniref:diguanylate cyclase n=1 Tax=Oceanimonas baumannii TaxID=129578 RepID=A0A235CNH9_9GAMM|nr:sensor domain-containing diguanylate cyclase [Oceanimonas baumannii]OYD26123.1 diguanylate cyclase [Oceanimonas baumannii]TDW62231.1 diguanylate cyclase (GGDEF)-like protein [Oceanimonas baumannii]